jgi:soluble lytic murein transglycosylase-like protein
MRGLTAVLVGFVACCGMGLATADDYRYVDGFIYKYVDKTGKIHFTDAPLKGNHYRLEWKRESRKLVRENKVRSASLKERATPSTKAKPRGGGAAISGTLAQRRAIYDELVHANSKRYGVPTWLIHAVIRAESAYNPMAVSHAGAEGLMQLMPGTAARYGVADSFDPAQNIRGGTAYLRDLLDMFDWELKLALAGYNAGEGAVMKHGRQIPPYAETQNYVRKVFEFGKAERDATTGIVMSTR